MELAVVSTNALRGVLAEIIPFFERERGTPVDVTFLTSKQIAHEIEKGMKFDVVFATTEGIRGFEESHAVLSGSRVDFARVEIGMAVQARAPVPKIDTLEELKETLLSARSVTYTSEGASGIHFSRVLADLGITQQIEQKALIPTGGLVAEAVASGDAELAIQLVSELFAVKGVTFVGPLPGAAQRAISFSAAIGSGSTHSQLADALISFAVGQRATIVLRANGMLPP